MTLKEILLHSTPFTSLKINKPSARELIEELQKSGIEREYDLSARVSWEGSNSRDMAKGMMILLTDPTQSNTTGECSEPCHTPTEDFVNKLGIENIPYEAGSPTMKGGADRRRAVVNILLPGNYESDTLIDLLAEDANFRAKCQMPPPRRSILLSPMITNHRSILGRSLKGDLGRRRLPHTGR